MKVGISVIDRQGAKMVKVRDLDRPSLFGLAPLVTDDTQLTEQEQFDAAVTEALKQLREKKEAK